MRKFVWFIAIVVALLILLRVRHQMSQPPPAELPAPAVPAPPPVPGTTVTPPAPSPTTTTLPPAPGPTGLDQGANAIIPGAMELYPTYSAIGMEMLYQGDANTNATSVMSWRHVGETDWRDGVDVTIDRVRHVMWASIWPLEQDEAIEVRLEIADPLPLAEPRIVKTRTRRMELTTTGGRSIYVSPTLGDDAGPGTKLSPYKTLNKAIRGFKAGDTIYAMSGTYPESVHLDFVKAADGQPAVITAAPGHRPVLDGSRVIRPGAGWSQVEPGFYAINSDMAPDSAGYVAQDGKRMFKYESVEALKKNEFGNERAWAYDAAKKRLYVRTGDAKSASGHSYNIAQEAFGFWLEGCKHVVISGFEIRNCGSYAIRLSGPNCIGNVIYGNTMHNCQQGVFAKTDTTENNAVWNNTVYEPGIRDFTWISIKHSAYARQGIMFFNCGRGNSVCHNKVHDWFDCVDVESWLHPDELGLNRDSDIMFNELWNVGDDAMELDGGGVNMRVHGNRIRNAHSAISLAPVERGPVYVTRNDATYHTLFLKMSVGSDSVGWTYIYNNSGYTIESGSEATMVRFNSEELQDTHRALMNNAIIGSEFALDRVRANHVLDYDCFYGLPGQAPRKFKFEGQIYRSLEDFQRASGKELHGLYADPKFVATPDLGKFKEGATPLYDDVSVGDMRPGVGSPLIDHGTVIRGVTEGFKGAAPDIGAFESGS